MIGLPNMIFISDKSILFVHSQQFIIVRKGRIVQEHLLCLLPGCVELDLGHLVEDVSQTGHVLAAQALDKVYLLQVVN